MKALSLIHIFGEAYDKAARALGFPYPGGVHKMCIRDSVNIVIVEAFSDFYGDRKVYRVNARFDNIGGKLRCV